MSLSRWSRDYVYIPLGGNRGSFARTLATLLTVFLLCGLWHGAQWTFVVWGAFHGFSLIAGRLAQVTPIGEWVAGRVPRFVAQAYALLAVVVGWMLFRADSLAQAKGVMMALVGHGDPCLNAASALGQSEPEAQLALGLGSWPCCPVDGLFRWP